MTLLQTLEDCAKQVSASFYFATPDKANVLMDEVLAMDFPVIIVLPYKVTDTTDENTGAIESEFDLDFYALQKRDDATMDFVQYDVEGEITKPMRSLARQFIHKIDKSDIVTATTKGYEKVTIERADGVLDAHLFGVKATANIPFIEQSTACI